MITYDYRYFKTQTAEQSEIKKKNEKHKHGRIHAIHNLMKFRSTKPPIFLVASEESRFYLGYDCTVYTYCILQKENSHLSMIMSLTFVYVYNN